ncbi:hypothetical protein N9K73_01645 [Candidatus Poseidoniales archaeon]|jgi:hypothetical protein|nr:hypothetical protein [Candidatus Poseidoniales archaeon]
MTNSHLYCIFNANDPTPTAIAIRSLNFKTATVFVVNHKAFTDKQNSNLDRLKKWINGSAKPEGWPEGWWNPDWDWAEASPQVSMEYVDELTPEIFGNTTADHTFVDLKGGTKAMSIDLMDYANERLDNPQFIFSNPGESLLLSKGVVLPRDVLGLNEIVFLASGYVMNEEYVPEPRIAEKIKLEFKYATQTVRKKRIARFDRDFLKSIKGDLPENSRERGYMEQRFLEEFTSAMLSVSEEVKESVAGVRFIDPSFEISISAAGYLLTLPDIKKMMGEEPEKKKIYGVCMKFLRNPEGMILTSESAASIEMIRHHMHIMEIDALAILSSGELIGVECKYGTYQPDDVHRIRAICQRLSPRSIPVLVNPKLYSTNVYNVAELSFTELDNAIEMIRQLDSQAPKRPKETILLPVEQSSTPATKRSQPTHVRAQRARHLYKCPECNFEGKLNKLNEHLRENPTHWSVHCGICQRALLNRGDLASHEISYGHPPSLPESGLINVQATTRIERPTPQIDDLKNKQGKGRNALHCLPLIEIAIVSASSTGGTFAMFKRAMSRLQISMEHMDEALTLLGEKLGFKINDKQNSHWIEWDSGVESEDDAEVEKYNIEEDHTNLNQMDSPLKGKRDETIRSLLELYKKSPRSFSEFAGELKKYGFPVKGLRKILVKKYSQIYNFEIVEGSNLYASGSQWIIWK